jgi:hypothetical protein
MKAAASGLRRLFDSPSQRKRVVRPATTRRCLTQGKDGSARSELLLRPCVVVEDGQVAAERGYAPAEIHVVQHTGQDAKSAIVRKVS